MWLLIIFLFAGPVNAGTHPSFTSCTAAGLYTGYQFKCVQL